VLTDALASTASDGQTVTGVVATGVSSTALYVKGIVVVVGLLLVLVAGGLPSRLRAEREAEAAGDGFDPATTVRGEFYAFMLFSLAGVMLVGAATDLAWLFLAIELTSLPTYVMIATSRDRIVAQESAVKYFFLGAMAAAMFLFGFTLLYGATGTTRLVGPTEPGGITSIAQFVTDLTHTGQPLSVLLTVGFVLSIVGLAFKVAAVPMHFYAADVYEGAATPVTAFLAFVPKTAGFVALILLLGPLTLAGADTVASQVVTWTLWGMAALTMTVGNVLGLLQSNVKRMLAYSSVAHSGYMLVALVAFAGPAQGTGDRLGDPFGAVLFYLAAYALGNLGIFAVLACLRRRGDDAETFDDLRGLSRHSPGLAIVLLVSVLSLLGLPPTVGFLGKVVLFSAAIDAGFVGLVVIGLLNSAVSAVYYLRLTSVAFFADPADDVTTIPAVARRTGGAVAAVAALVLGVAGGPLVKMASTDTDASPLAPSNIVTTPPTDAVQNDTDALADKATSLER